MARGLAQIPGVKIQPEKVITNILFFELPEDLPAARLITEVSSKGVKLGYRGIGRRVRVVTHWMITSEDIDYALESLRKAIEDTRRK
jgi:threonine aldolase